MKSTLIHCVSLFCLLQEALAVESLFKIPTNAAQQLPPGVPRTVDTNGRVIAIDGMFTSDAYQHEALRLVIEEANKVAQETHLDERLPIIATNLTQAYIGPFGYNYQLSGLGNITTSNYTYGVNRDYKFSDLTIARYDERCRGYYEQYQWPITRLDTNFPYHLATQWLAAVHMDLTGLNRDCNVRVTVDPYWNNVELGQLPKRIFTPMYYVLWTPRGVKSKTGAAQVEIFLPTRTLLQLNVYDPKYILRRPIVFTNLAALFPGKGEIRTNRPGPIIDIHFR